jgi:phosphatidylglycerol:prolipoprotein diacylglycerol transferase
VYPVLFHLENMPLSTYSLLLGLGSLVGLALAVWQGREYGLAPELTLDAAIWVFLAGGIAGRLGYVLANWEFFAANLPQVIAPWRGGSSAPAALLGGLGGLHAWAYARRRSPRLHAGQTWRQPGDAMAPALALGSAFVWAGCLLTGAAYGREGSGPLQLSLPDLYGVANPRFPTQLLGLLLSLGILLLAWAVRRQRPWPGVPFTLTVALLAAAHFALDFTRGDESLILWGLRAGQWADVVLIVALLACLGVPPALRASECASRPGSVDEGNANEAVPESLD